MRVMVYLYYYPPYRYVGGELMTAHLLEHLAKAGHTVDVYAEYVPKSYERNGVRIHCARDITMLRASAYDVFLTHPEIRTRVWLFVNRMPYAAVVHNTNPQTMRSLERQPPDLAIANSWYTMSRLPTVAQANAHVVHPPSFPADPTTHGTMYTAVNISRDKGGDVLRHVARKNPGLAFQAVIGGHGEQIRDQPANVIQIPATPDMDSVYADTRALLFPSRTETYGMVVAEAIMRGIPVVASNLPAIREAGGSNAAVYISPDDYEEWDHQVKDLQDPAVHDYMASRARARSGYLARRTQEDLDRWTTLITGIAR